jgi:hypothetical protein
MSETKKWQPRMTLAEAIATRWGYAEYDIYGFVRYVPGPGDTMRSGETVETFLREQAALQARLDDEQARIKEHGSGRRARWRDYLRLHPHEGAGIDPPEWFK